MDSVQIAIIPKTNRLSTQEAAIGAAAIQQQIQEHFSQIWLVTGIVTTLPDAVSGYIPVYVYDDIQVPGLTGYHQTQNGQFPYAVVQYGPTWTLAASHECLEMIIDPTAQRTWASMLPNATRQVNFLLEICDPCQDYNFSYKIGPYQCHVSDFYTRNYFDSFTTPGMTYSFTGNIKEPKTILPGGTLSWIDVDGNAYQCSNVGGTVQTTNLGPFRGGMQAAREFMNGFDQAYTKLSLGPHDQDVNETFKIQEVRSREIWEASESKRREFERDINERFKRTK